MKKLINRLFVAVMAAGYIISFGACKGEKQYEPKEYTVDFDVIPTDEAIGIILDLNIKGDTLLVNQFSGDYFLNWISLEDGKLLHSALTRGSAYKEMIGPLQVNMVGDSLTIFDKQKRWIYKSDYLCDTVIKCAEKLPHLTLSVFPLSSGVNIVSKLPMDDKDKECYESRFTAMRGDSVIAHFGQYPDYTASDQRSNMQQKAFFHQTYALCELPDDRFVVATSHTLSLYSAKDGKYELIKEIVVAPYEYHTTEATQFMGATAELDEGYEKGLMGQMFYHSGKLYMAYKRSDDRIIRCYDPDLNLIGEISTNLPIDRSFAIDDQGRIIGLLENENSTDICISQTSVNDLW